MSEPTTSQQQASDILWQEIAPDEYRLLLQADSEQDEDDNTVFLWLAAAFAYYDLRKRRRIVPAGIRAILDDALKNSRSAIDDITRQLITGDIRPAKWQLEMVRIIEQGHLAGGAAARGGWGQLTQADLKFIQGLTDRQIDFLDGFLGDIASGKQRLNGNAMRRARMYGEAIRGTYEDTRRRLYSQSGFTEERRVLGKAEHCPDCVDYAGRGWQPIGTLPRIGESVCRTNCHCHFEYRNANGQVNR